MARNLSWKIKLNIKQVYYFYLAAFNLKNATVPWFTGCIKCKSHYLLARFFFSFVIVRYTTICFVLDSWTTIRKWVIFIQIFDCLLIFYVFRCSHLSCLKLCSCDTYWFFFSHQPNSVRLSFVRGLRVTQAIIPHHFYRYHEDLHFAKWLWSCFALCYNIIKSGSQHKIIK